MKYEKIILELMERIQKLEEQVAVLIEQNENKMEMREDKVTTNDIREYIKELKTTARAKGKNTIVLKSGDVHKDLGLKNAMPQVCNAMYDCMNNDDIVLHTTPSGKSSTIQIEYKI